MKYVATLHCPNTSNVVQTRQQEADEDELKLGVRAIKQWRALLRQGYRLVIGPEQ